ncbi:filamentous hemagglutinin N-terminal domain-containing protein [Bacterioplanes sanyensis]|nr:filamentous hemagglutinin N-terminal domain-containing protein [Bacterioplanes sanyensis]
MAVLDSIRNQRNSWLAKALVYCISVTFMVPVVPASYAAGIVTDPNAEVRFQPQVNIHNSVPVVNIVTPDNTGLSHNRYEQFNVDKNGAVLNNSLVSGTSRLAAEIIANPNLNGVAASTILNEVTSSSNTKMLGALEVFGESANVIIANRNGITCNDCGFINTDRVTLTTGLPQYIGNALYFDITDGTVTFAGEGVDHKLSPEILDVFARYIDVNGEVQSSQQLNLISGALSLNYTDLLLGEVDVTPLAADAAENRTYAIDASIFGAMQSGKISVMATEEGLGVRSDSYLFSQSDSLFIESAGDIALRDADSFVGIEISTPNDVEVSEDLVANTLVLTQSDNFRNTEQSEVTADIVNLSSDTSIELHGEVNSRETDINSQSAYISADLISLGDIKLDVNAVTLNGGEIVADEVRFNSDSINMEDALLSSSFIDFDVNDSLLVDESELVTQELIFDGGAFAVSGTSIAADLFAAKSGVFDASNSSIKAGTLNVDANSSRLVDNDIHTVNFSLATEDLDLNRTAIVSKDLMLESGKIFSRDGRYQTENATISGENVTLVRDRWTVLSFDPNEGVSTVANSNGQFVLDASQLNAVKTNVVANVISSDGDVTILQNTNLNANELSLNGKQLTIDNNSKISSSESTRVAAQLVDSQADFDVNSLVIDADSLSLGGKLSASSFVNLNGDEILLSQAQVTTDTFNVSGDTLESNLTTVVSRAFNASIASLIDLETMQINSDSIGLRSHTINSGPKVSLEANGIAVHATDFFNSGKLYASDFFRAELERTFENSGKIISYDDLTIAAETIGNKASGQIASITMDMQADDIDNHGELGSDALKISYGTLSNYANSSLVAENLTLSASDATSVLYNEGRVSIAQLMSWDNELREAGNLSNVGQLEAGELDLSGLNHVSVGSNGTVNVKHGVSGEIGRLSQAGEFSSDSLHLTADAVDNFGKLQANIVSLNTAGDVHNSGVITSESIMLTADAIINDHDAEITSQYLQTESVMVENHGSIAASELNIRGASDVATFKNYGDVVQRNEFAGEQHEGGSLVLKQFDSVENDGQIEADDSIFLIELSSILNGVGDDSATILSSGNIEASAHSTIQNAGLLVGRSVNISAKELVNSGKISVTSAEVNIGEAFDNSGILYQRDEALSDEYVNVNAATFVNGEDAVTEVIRGVLDLSSGTPGTLINKGVLAERREAANSGLAMRGIGALQNSGQISMSAELSITGGDFHNEGSDAYIGVGVLNFDALQSLVNDGSLVYDNDSRIVAQQFNNTGTVASTDENQQVALALDADALTNAGRVSTSGGLSVNQNVAGTITNQGLIYGQQVHIGSATQRQVAVTNSGANIQNPTGEMVAGGFRVAVVIWLLLANRLPTIRTVIRGNSPVLASCNLM